MRRGFGKVTARATIGREQRTGISSQGLRHPVVRSAVADRSQDASSIAAGRTLPLLLARGDRGTMGVVNRGEVTSGGLRS